METTTPPRIEPAHWEDFPGFRETFLLYFTEPPHAAALRGLGALLYELVLEHYRYWPAWPEGTTATEMRAALADLRYLQGFLNSVGREREASALTGPENRLSRLAGSQAGELERIADEIEQALGETEPEA